jgi:hypothetical protein
MRSEQGKHVLLPLEIYIYIYKEYTDMRSEQGKAVLLPLEKNIYIKNIQV